MKQAKSTIELEGQNISVEQQVLVEKVIKGEITDADFIKEVCEMVKKKS